MIIRSHDTTQQRRRYIARASKKGARRVRITVERGDEGEFIASDDIFQMYGVGHSISEAVKDYLAVITEYHQHLARDTSEPDIALFEYLENYFVGCGVVVEVLRSCDWYLV